MSKPRNQGLAGVDGVASADEVRRRLDHGPRDHRPDRQQERDRHAIRQADRARAQRDDGRGHEAEANHPGRHGRVTAEEARAD